MSDSRIANQSALKSCDSVVDRFDEGTGKSEGYIEIRTTPVPTDVDAAATGTLLATLPMSNPAFGAAADLAPGARATANAITSDAAADNTGAAAYYRGFDRDDNPIIQGDVTVITGGGDMEINNINIQAGVQVDVTSYLVTQRES